MLIRSTRIALAILCSLFLFGIVNNSLAIEIVNFPSNTEDTSYNGYTYHMAYLKTDVPFYSVIWYVNDTFVSSSYGGHEKTEAWFYPNSLTGSIKGVKHTIKAKVMRIEDDGTTLSDTDSYTVKMFEPIYLYKPGEKTGAWGSVEISRFYYDGSKIVMSASASAYNPSDNPKAGDLDKFPLTVLPWFWTHKYPAPDGNASDEHRDTKDSETIDLGESSDTATPGPNRQEQIGGDDAGPFDRHIGVLAKGGDPRYFKAHAHLQVYGARTGTDNWEVDTQQQTGTAAVTFTYKDGP